MQRSFILKFGISLVVFGIILAIAAFAYYKFTGRGGAGEYGVNKSKTELMEEYKKYSNAGDDFKAFRAVKALTKKDPDNIELMRKAADAAIKAGKKYEANEILQKLWDSGERDPKTLFTLVATSILPKIEQRKKTLKLISEIKQENLRKKLYALYYYQMEKYEQAEEYFEWLVNNDPHPAIYEYYARNYLFLRMPNEAMKVLEDAQKSGYLGAGGEIILANLYAVDNRLDEEEELFKSFVSRNGASDYVVLSHAIILFANNRMDEAGEYLQGISHSYRFAADNVVYPKDMISKLSEDPELKPLMDKLSDRTKNVIKADENDIFELSLFSEYIAQDFNRIAGANSQDRDEFVKELKKLKKLFMAELAELGSNKTAYQARLYLAPILFKNKDKAGLESLLIFASGSDGADKGEAEYIQYFIDKLNNVSGAEKRLEAVEELVGRNAAVLLVEAKEKESQKDYNAAVRYYSLAAKQNKTIGSGSYLLENLARALAEDEKYLASFELIRRMHNKRMISKNTLVILRDVAYPAGFPEVSSGAQKVLEKKYGASADVVLGEAELRLKEGNAQAALEVFEKLIAAGIEPTYEARVNSVMAEAMLQLRRFEGVIDIVDQKDIDSSYKARALYGLGKHDEAIDLFSEVDTDPTEKGQWRIEYGLLLALKGREEEAAIQFQKAIDDNPKMVRAYVELSSILLKHNQYAAAKVIAQEALNLVPNLVRPKLVVANVDIVEGNNASAEILLNDILYKYPRNIDALFLKSRSLVNQGEYDKALKVIDSCLQMKPMYPLFLQQKIDILVSLDKMEEAVKIAGLGIETGMDTGLFEHARIMLNLQQNKTEEAMIALKQARSISESDRLILESQILEAEGKVGQAIDKLKPYVASPKVKFRILELIISDPDSSTNDIKYVKDSLKNFNLPVKTLLVLGMLAEENSKYGLAGMIYSQGLSLEPDEIHLLNNYIWVSLKAGNAEEGALLKDCDRALTLYPENPMIIDTCVAVFNKYGKYDMTLDVLKLNPEVVRKNPVLYLPLGDAWSAKGERREAINAYEHAARAAGDNEEMRTEAESKLAEMSE